MQRPVVRRRGGGANTVSSAVTLTCVALLLLLAAVDPGTTVLSQLGFILLVLAAVVLHVVVHEAVHALTASLVGMHVPEVEIGGGSALLRFRLGTTAVKLGGFHGGATYLEPRSPTRLRARLALVALAGPSSNLALAAAVYLLLDPDLTTTGSFTGALVTAGVLLGVVNLLPLRVRTRHGNVETDGRLVLSLLRTDPGLGERLVAAGRLSALHRRHVAGDPTVSSVDLEPVRSTDPVILGIEGTRRILTGEYAQAVSLLREAVAHPQEEDKRANSLNNLAWALVLSRPPGWLEEADRASAEAISLRPRMTPMMSTRGCVLVHLEEHAQARHLILAALRSTNAPGDEVVLQSHLLRAQRALGNLHGAREALLAMVDLGAPAEDVAAHRALLRGAEVDNALANLVGPDGLICWPAPGRGRRTVRHTEEIRRALLAFVQEGSEDERREAVRLALGA